MTIEAVTAPVPASHLVEFNPGPDERAWGHLETPAGRIGVLYQRSPQPHLSLYPPVRVPEGGADAFLQAIMDNAQHGGRAEWLRLSVDPLDGEVDLRMSLASESPAEMDRALEEARAFFEEAYPALAAACLVASEEDGDEEGGEGEREGILSRLFDW